MSDRKTITVELFDFSYDDTTMPLGDFLAMVSNALEGVPEAYRDTAVFIHTYGYGEETSKCRAEYQRPETDKEMATREATTARYDAEAEAQQRAWYEQLKAKFGP